MKPSLGGRLQYALDLAQTTQLALSKYLGVSSSAVNQWVMNATKPKLLHKIEEFFSTFDMEYQVTAWWLAHGGE